MFNSFALRQFVAAFARATGQQQRSLRETAWPDYFDNTDGIGPVKRTLFYKGDNGIMLPFKGRPKPVPIERKIGIEAHITAVAFGTTSKSRAFWLNLIENGDIPPDLWALFGSVPEAAARRMALHQRFWVVPYHWVGLLNGDVLHNNDITRYTFHGSGGNGPLVGVCMEGDFPGLEANRKKKHNDWDEHTIETGRAALRLAVVHSRDAGAPIEELYAHRQYSKGRVGDPGEGWWREVGVPVAKELNLAIKYDFKYGNGLYLPREWDANGIVDYRGRPIAS